MPSVCPPGVKHQSPAGIFASGRNLKRRTQQGAFLMAGKLTAAFRPAVLPAVDLMLAVPSREFFFLHGLAHPCGSSPLHEGGLSPAYPDTRADDYIMIVLQPCTRVLRLRFFFRRPRSHQGIFSGRRCVWSWLWGWDPSCEDPDPAASFRTKGYQDWDHAASNR